MAGISSITSTPSIDTLVNRFLEVDRKQLTTSTYSTQNLSKRLSALNTLKAKLNTVDTRIESFTTTTSDSVLGVKKAVSSDEKIFTAEATSSASTGINTIFVTSTARKDTAISKQFNRTGTDLASKFDGQFLTFKIKVGDDSAKTLSFSVSEGESNISILRSIRDAINSSSVDISASVINDSPTTARLTLVAEESGEDNSFTLQDTNGIRVLKELGFIQSNDQRRLASGTDGGYITPDTENLNAAFTLNGIPITNNSNTITDVLSGVTINLVSAQQTGESAETLTIGLDDNSTKEQVEGFIEDYNDLMEFLTESTSINPTTKERGELSGVYTYRNLRINLRTTVGSRVTSVDTGNPSTLRDIGISIDRSGNLELSDEDKFTEALEDDADAILDLFTSSRGIATRMEALITPFRTTGGIIDDNRSSTNLLTQKVSKRESNINSRLQIRENTLRRQFSDLQKSLSRLNSQQTILNRISNIFSSFTSGKTKQSSFFQQ